MKLLTLIILAVLLSAPLIFAAVLFAAIIINVRAGLRYRLDLARELGRLRLSKMLGALGIDSGAYLHRERVTDIYDAMARCEHCANTRECDHRLVQGAIAPDQIGFCANEAPLRQIIDRGSRDVTA